MKKLSDKVTGLSVSAALAVDLRAKALEKEGRRVVNFCVGEPDFPTPGPICDAGIQAIRSGKTKYTNASGSPGLKTAVCRSLQERFGLSYTEGNIAVTAGGKYAVYAAVCTLTDPGDEVILPAPYWTSYRHIITLSGAMATVVTGTPENGWKLTPEALRNAATEKTKALILNNPNNPSGALYSRAELTALYEVIRELDLYVICDEIYDCFAFTEEGFVSFASLSEDAKERTVLINGMSKDYAMTGWRLGFMAAGREIIAGVSAMLSHTTGCPSAISQEAAIAALGGSQEERLTMSRLFRERRDLLVSELSGIPGFTFTVPEGAFYLMPLITEPLDRLYPDGTAFAEAILLEAGVATVPCADYGVPKAVRLSYSLSPEEIREGARRIRDFVNEKLDRVRQ